MINLDAINSRLSERRVSMLSSAVYKLETGIEAGAVRNVDFNDAKDTINRAIDEASSAYDKATNDYSMRTLIMGAYNLPAGIKEATKKGDAKRAAFLSAMLPLNELIQAAKPIIVKRNAPGAPKVLTAQQAAREAATMTCQCCARKHLANTGKIAHHGYQRPGGGWQTASCMGARELPFEVSRDRLGDLLGYLKQQKTRMIDHRNAIAAETVALPLAYTDYSKPAEKTFPYKRPVVHFEVTRETFEAKHAEHADGFMRSISHRDFDSVKTSELSSADREIKNISDEIDFQQKRYTEWKQTHVWQSSNKTWQLA